MTDKFAKRHETADLIRERLDSVTLSMRKIAREAGITEANLGSIRHARADPSAEELGRIAQALQRRAKLTQEVADEMFQVARKTEKESARKEADNQKTDRETMTMFANT